MTMICVSRIAFDVGNDNKESVRKTNYPMGQIKDQPCFIISLYSQSEIPGSLL